MSNRVYNIGVALDLDSSYAKRHLQQYLCPSFQFYHCINQSNYQIDDTDQHV
jgi:hypothetical protein